MEDKITRFRRALLHADQLLTLAMAAIGVPQLLYYLLTLLARRKMLSEGMVLFYQIFFLVLAALIFFSTVRAGAICEEELHRKMYATSVEPKSLPRLKYLPRHRPLLFKACVWAALMIVPPLPTVSGAASDLFGIGWGFAEKLPIIACMLGACAALTILAYLSAFRYIRQMGMPNQPKKLYTRLIFRISLIYGVGSLPLTFLLPLAITLFKTFFNKTVGKILLFAAIAAFIFLLVRLLRLIGRRRKLLARLKKICREKGYDLSPVRAPYRSLFFFREGESFRVTVGEAHYSCMLISGRRKGVPIMVTDKGACIFLHALRIRRTEIFSYSVYRPIDYPTEDRRILIISPVPVSVLGSSRAKITTLDNGVTVDKYKVYSGTAFLNALERACLER